MTGLFSLNYPAAACLLTLLALALYHLLAARRREYRTALFPSSLNLVDGGTPLSIWSRDDLAVNCPLTLEQLSCRRLLVGPKGAVEIREIVAEEVEVRGLLRVSERFEVRRQVTVFGRLWAFRLNAPRLVLKRKSEAVVQVVPRHTTVVRGRKSRTQGFFASLEELDAARSHGSQAAAAKQPPGPANVRVLRTPAPK